MSSTTLINNAFYKRIPAAQHVQFPATFLDQCFMRDITAAAIHDFPAIEIIDLSMFLPLPLRSLMMHLSVHANARAFKSPRTTRGRLHCLTSGWPSRGHRSRASWSSRGINHRSRRLALANLSSASETLNLSTGQRTARSGAARFARRTRFFDSLI